MKDYEEYVRIMKGETDRQDSFLGIEPFARMAKENEFVSQLDVVELDSDEITPGILLHFLSRNKVCVRKGTVHTLVSGLTGTGKSLTVIIPNIRYNAKAKIPMVIVDPKGEVLQMTGRELEDEGYLVMPYYLKEPQKGIRMNPLYMPATMMKSNDLQTREDGELEMSDIFYEMIVAGTPRSESYWSDNPWDFATGLTKELIRRAKGRFEVTIPMVKDAANMILNTVESMDDFEETLASNNPYRSEMMNMLTVKSDVTRSGMMGFLNKGTSFCKSGGMRDMLSGNDLDIHDIAAGKPIALFIVCPDSTSIYDSLVSITIGQIIHTLYRDADNLYGGRLPKDVLFILDEFANFPQIPGFDKVITTARSRGLRFVISVQSINQLFSRYGSVADTIIDNCKDWVCTSGDPVFSRRLSEKIGPNAAEKDVITYNTLRCLPPGRPLVLLDRSNPFISTMYMAEKPAKIYEVKTRFRGSKENIDLEKLVFNPALFDREYALSHGTEDKDEAPSDEMKRDEISLDTDKDDEKGSCSSSDLDLETDLRSMGRISKKYSTDVVKEIIDDLNGIGDDDKGWSPSIGRIKWDMITNCRAYDLWDSYVRDWESLLFGVLYHLVANDLYEGQAIKVDSLVELQECLKDNLTFSRLMELVVLLLDDDYAGSAEAIIDSHGAKKGVTKSELKKVIKKVNKDLYFLKKEED